MQPEAERTERTERLILTPITQADLAPLHAIYSDPATWRHLPSGRFREEEQTRALISAMEEAWQRDGLGPWAIRLAHRTGDLPRGAFLGNGGVMATRLGVWNLGYRLVPASWGHGFATEVCAGAIAQAQRTQPGKPVTARALTTNPASIRVLEKAGLTLQWRGRGQPDAADDGTRPAPRIEPDRETNSEPETIEMERAIYADRPLGQALLDELIALG